MERAQERRRNKNQFEMKINAENVCVDRKFYRLDAASQFFFSSTSQDYSD